MTDNKKMLVREGTLDQYVINEQKGYNPLFEKVSTDDSLYVLDIGANIGAFSAKFGAEYPNANFVGFEPDPTNFGMAIENTDNLDNVSIYEGAVAAEDGELTFYLNNKKNKGLHSLIPIRGREEIKVRAIEFGKILNKYEPRILKMDIEGGEFFLGDWLFDLPDYIESIAIELHLTKKETKPFMWELYESVKKQFPNVVVDPHLDEKPIETCKTWAVVMIAHRS